MRPSATKRPTPATVARPSFAMPMATGTDADGDGAFAAGCCQLGSDGELQCGGDRDDGNSALGPHAAERCQRSTTTATGRSTRTSSACSRWRRAARTPAVARACAAAVRAVRGSTTTSTAPRARRAAMTATTAAWVSAKRSRSRRAPRPVIRWMTPGALSATLAVKAEGGSFRTDRTSRVRSTYRPSSSGMGMCTSRPACVRRRTQKKRARPCPSSAGG